MMSSSNLQLYRIDLSTNSRNTFTALIKLLAPHVPYSLQILGTVLNTGPRPSTLQDVDPSKLSLWSTIPLHSDAIPTTDRPALFSIVAYSHLNHQFSFFCSGESRAASSDPPTEAEETHVKQVFERLRDMANEARPTYDSLLISLGESEPRHRVDTDPSMIIVGGVHAKWRHILALMSGSQCPNVRYAFPRGAFRVAHEAANRFRGAGHDEVEILSSSEIRASDIPFVHGASSIPRSEAYILSRAPHSVCIRSRADGGRPVACALMHSDGSIGALHVDPKYQRQGLGTRVIRALTEKLDFSSESQDDVGLLSDDHYQDLGGGALGWNWTDAAACNEAGNRFFTSLADKEGKWTCYWIYMLVNPNQ